MAITTRPARARPRLDVRGPPRRGHSPPRGAADLGLHYLTHAYVRAGRRADAERLYAEQRAVANRRAVIAAALVDVDATFEALERQMADEPHRVAQRLIQPEFALLRVIRAGRPCAARSDSSADGRLRHPSALQPAAAFHSISVNLRVQIRQPGRYGGEDGPAADRADGVSTIF